MTTPDYSATAEIADMVAERLWTRFRDAEDEQWVSRPRAAKLCGLSLEKFNREYHSLLAEGFPAEDARSGKFHKPAILQYNAWRAGLVTRSDKQERQKRDRTSMSFGGL